MLPEPNMPDCAEPASTATMIEKTMKEDSRTMAPSNTTKSFLPLYTLNINNSTTEKTTM